MRMSVTVRVAVRLVVLVRVRMFMVMIVDVRVIVLAVVQPLARPWTARIFAEHQRFDGDRHSVGRHANAAEIDIVEVPQHDAVDDQQVAQCGIRREGDARACAPRRRPA